MYKENKELENRLREEWNRWNSKSHEEDQMSFLEYLEEIGIYSGHKIYVDRDGYECKILFS
jgi:hypothetical protein